MLLVLPVLFQFLFSFFVDDEDVRGVGLCLGVQSYPTLALSLIFENYLIYTLQNYLIYNYLNYKYNIPIAALEHFSLAKEISLQTPLNYFSTVRWPCHFE